MSYYNFFTCLFILALFKCARYEGIPFKSIYKHKTIYVKPWEESLLDTYIDFTIITLVLSVAFFYSQHMNAVIIILLLSIGFYGRKAIVKIRISPKKLAINYFDAETRIKWQRYIHIRIHIEDIKNIERIHFLKFYADFDESLTNRKLDGTYSYVITCSYESAKEGIDITLSNGKHIVFETDDVENCIRVLKNVSGLH